MIVLVLRAKYYQNLEENISARLSKWHFRCPEEESEQKYIYFWKKFFLFTFVTLVKSSRLLAKIFQRGRHNWFLSIQWNVLKKEFLEQTKFLNHFRLLTEKNYVLLAKKCSTVLSKLISMCPEERFEDFSLGKRTYNFLPFPNFEQKFYGLSAEVSSRLIKTEFNVSRRMCWGFFWKTTFTSWFSHFEQKK